ncbi:glycin-rich protein [Sesbania bispinosa]|nr:glycin-rich protein [Sesbania bispinosa]
MEVATRDGDAFRCIDTAGGEHPSRGIRSTHHMELATCDGDSLRCIDVAGGGEYPSRGIRITHHMELATRDGDALRCIDAAGGEDPSRKIRSTHHMELATRDGDALSNSLLWVLYATTHLWKHSAIASLQWTSIMLHVGGEHPSRRINNVPSIEMLLGALMLQEVSTHHVELTTCDVHALRCIDVAGGGEHPSRGIRSTNHMELATRDGDALRCIDAAGGEHPSHGIRSTHHMELATRDGDALRCIDVAEATRFRGCCTQQRTYGSIRPLHMYSGRALMLHAEGEHPSLGIRRTHHAELTTCDGHHALRCIDAAGGGEHPSRGIRSTHHMELATRDGDALRCIDVV